MARALALASLTLLTVLPSCASDRAARAEDASPAVLWEGWSEPAFERAKSERRLVLLDLQAVWCHWCHVMEETTYRDPEVVELLTRHFVAIQVDQDARPDVSLRYEDYGWPATILFDSQGREIAKRSGYIPPEQMRAFLAEFVADPTPGPSIGPARAIAFASGSALDGALRAELEALVTARYDFEDGGYGVLAQSHKYVDAPSVEWLLEQARAGDETSARMARQTLDAALALVDPAWGGIYQYSTGGAWNEPHFEKIMALQTDCLIVYAQAYATFGEPRYARAAQDIRRFLATFLKSPAGAYFTSQDADLVPGEHAGEYFALDDAGRRRLGIPRVDTHVYARENGWAIEALCALAMATGDESATAEARAAAEWVVARRALPGGGFRHDEEDAAGPYLGDTLAMGQGFLALYEATGERAWLDRALESARFIARSFAAPEGRAGFRVAAARAGGPIDAAIVQRDENVRLARFANRLHHATASPDMAPLRDEALRFVTTREIAVDGLPGGILLATSERERDPLHLTVVGKKNDPAARALFRAAQAIPGRCKRVEWYDAAEGPLRNDDVPFPELPRAAAFVCAEGRCASPAYEPADVAARVAAATGR